MMEASISTGPSTRTTLGTPTINGLLSGAEIARLQQVQPYPAVSVLMPTSDSPPGDRARLARLFDVVARRLLVEFPRPAMQGLLDDLDDLDALGARSDLPWGHESLALFVSNHNSVAVALPIVVRERVVIDETFATRDLVHAALRSPAYRVLVLGGHVTRLYTGLGRILTETTHDGFPVSGVGEVGRANRSRLGVDRSAPRDNRLRRHGHAIDSALAAHMGDNVPLIVVGAGRRLNAFRQHSQFRNQMSATRSGAFDHRPARVVAREVAELAWPAMCEVLERRQQTALSELDRAVSVGRHSIGADQVWESACSGRGSLVVVEENYAYPARVDLEHNWLVPADDVEHPEVVDDMVDDILEIVLAKRGRVAIVPDGVLADRGRIAMTLRY